MSTAIKVAVAAACALAWGAAPTPRNTFRMVRQGPERLRLIYADPQHAAKDLLFERINRDRSLHGVAPLRSDPRLALVGDRFCLDAAMAGSTGHWDVAGRAPFVRWGLAGGVDFQAENAGSYSVSGGTIGDKPEAIALQIHESMMAERSPEDGHRRTILDPLLTHVGIGLAQVGGELRFSEEFSRVAFEWVEIPDRPVRPGTIVEFAGKPLAGYEVGAVEIAFEPPLRPATPRELSRRGSYGYPRAFKTLRPMLPRGWLYSGGARGDFEVADTGAFRIQFACDRGAGYYFVLCYVRRKGHRDVQMHPATAAMITVTR